jgi:hypothetical protein
MNVRFIVPVVIEVGNSSELELEVTFFRVRIESHELSEWTFKFRLRLDDFQ